MSAIPNLNEDLRRADSLVNSDGNAYMRVNDESAASEGREPFRMTFKYVKKSEVPALLLNGTTLVKFGEFGLIVGLPGAGKSGTGEELVCAYLGGSNYGFTFNARGKKVLFIDTERHPDDVSDSYHNIARRLREPKLDSDGEIDGLVYLSLADFGTVKELRAILEEQLNTELFDFVIIDGALDFTTSINDEEEAAACVKWFRALAVRHNCAMMFTYHPNKGTENLAGHFGGFLYRWARAVLFVRGVKGDKSVKEITTDAEMAKLSHGDVSGLNPVYLKWDSRVNLLMPCDYDKQQDRGKEDKVTRALTSVFSGGRRYRHGELVKALMDLGHSESTAKRYIKKGEEMEIISESGAIYKGSGSGSLAQ